MRHLQLLFCGVALVAALVALAQHLGFDLWSCASCSAVKALPVGAVLAWVGPFALALLTYGVAKEKEWAMPVNLVAGVCSLGLVLWMISSRTVCIVCLLVHIGTIASALCWVPKQQWVGPSFFALAVVFTATDGWDRFTVVQGVGIFRPRPGEKIPSGKVYVMFTDPECTRCRVTEQAIARLKPEPTVLHRWCILPQSAYRSMRAAAMLEMARLSQSPKYKALAAELGREVLPLTDEVLLTAAERFGIRVQAADWLSNPREDALVAIQADNDTANELQIESLPALAELSAPDATGLRTLRRVPFSTIGVGR